MKIRHIPKFKYSISFSFEINILLVKINLSDKPFSLKLFDESFPSYLGNLYSLIMLFQLCNNFRFVWLQLFTLTFISLWKESRTNRVDSWRTFQAGGKKKKEKKGRTAFKPPALRPEKRWASESVLSPKSLKLLSLIILSTVNIFILIIWSVINSDMVMLHSFLIHEIYVRFIWLLLFCCHSYSS